MKNSILTFFFLLSLTVVFAQIAQPKTDFTKLWETDPGLKIPESVLYDSVTGLIFVSNIEGNPSKKDSTGFISTLSADGNILKSDWVKGIDAPKGMAILNNHLFVSNIDEVVEIDIAAATIVKRYPISGSKFLNDIAIDPKTGMVFITDTETGVVYVMLNGKSSIWLQDALYKGANGLYLKDNQLYIGTGNSIMQADILTGSVIVCIANTGSIDGLFVASDNNFIYSDWKGSVFIAAKNRKPRLLLSTTAQKVNAADFGVIPSKNMILIPTFGNNKVVAYTSDCIK
jgi:DNA-binding beta-propeller fold protein YncE